VTSLPCFKLRLMHQTLIRHSSETLHALIGPDQTIRRSDTGQTLTPLSDSDYCIKPAK